MNRSRNVTDQPTGVARAAATPTQPETAQPETVQRGRPATGDAPAGAGAGPGAAAGSGDLTDDLLRSDQWTDEMLQAAGIPVMDVPLVSIGGGIGSFVTVDYLRIAGVAADRIAVLTNLDFAWQTYEYLTRVSQIPKPERIRSDSASRPDNIWGLPSYALAEAMSERTFAPLWQVLVEPIGADYYTPTKRMAFLAEFVHLAVGYPGLRFLPELQDFGTELHYFHHVVSAYELHE